MPEQVILDLNDMEKIMPLKPGTELSLTPKGKVILDADDRVSAKKVSYKVKKKKSKHKTSTVKKVSYKNKKKTSSARSKNI